MGNREFTMPDLDSRSKDEVGVATQAFNSVKNSLRSILSHFKVTINKLNEESNSLKEVSQQSMEALDTINTIFHEIAAGSREQTKDITVIMNKTEDLSKSFIDVSLQSKQQVTHMKTMLDTVIDFADSFTHISGLSKEISEKSQEALLETENGEKVVQKTLESMFNIREVVATNVDKTTALEESSKKIGDIIAVIFDIASQTNLLALNAAIEAARAGEHGKGFAVVADEVRKLAEKSADATNEIETVLSTLSKDISFSVKAMRETDEKVKAGVELAQTSRSAMSQVRQVVEVTADNAAHIMHRSSEMQNNNTEMIQTGTDSLESIKTMDSLSQGSIHNFDEIIQMIQSISAVIEEHDSSTNEAEMTAKVLLDGINELIQTADRIDDMSNQVNSEIELFKLD